MKTKLLAACAALMIAAGGGEAVASNITPYYLFDGEAGRAVIIENGVVTGAFDIFNYGAAVAIGSTIWLGDRDDVGATEYTLDGLPTGNTGTGGSSFSQVLDGAYNGKGVNYGVLLGASSAVTVANADWSDQQVLFDLDEEAQGIAYDLATDHLFLVIGNQIVEYDLAGNLINAMTVGRGLDLVGLAYEQETDTLWAWDKMAGTLNQYRKDGLLLDSIEVDLSDTGVAFPYGGEMPVLAAPTAVPEPGTLALVAGSLLGLAWGRRRKAA
jgi:hypothetical protein